MSKAEDVLTPVEALVLELNDGPEGWGRPEVHPKLVQLIQAWQESTEKWRALSRTWKASGSPEDSIPRPVKIQVPEGCPTLVEMGNRCRVLLSPHPGGWSWHPGVVYASLGKGWTTWDFACSKFLHLVMDPECHKFGGPCPYCGKFFVRKTAKEKRYCSKGCAHKAAAKASTQRLRYREHELKVARTREVIEKWSQGSRKMDWISWVTSNVPEISKTWLTRAINRNEITSPVFPGRPRPDPE
jgi:hypothetical protein